MIFERATKQDKQELLKLYKSLVGTEYCAWTDMYPEMAEIEFDLSRDALFCYRDKGQIVASISIDQDEDVASLPCWTKELQPAVELSRLAVRADYQNQGIAGQMIRNLMQLCKAGGIRSVHFLVSKHNIKAQRAYKKLECNIVGEANLFNEEWFCYEKAL